MPGSTPFRLNKSGFLLAMISAAFAGQASAAAGKVDFSLGGATVTGSDGRQRALAKGLDLDSGDTIRTNQGRAQIRFTDGSYVSLQPDTEFGIKEYRFEEKSEGSERGFFALAKGAMRTVTGLIGRSNRNAYQISTPTATIGIRGTGGVIQVLNDGSTLVTGTSGIWSLSNPAGSIDIPAGVSGVAPSKPDSPPQQTSQAPSTAPAPVQTQQTQVSQGDKKTSDGKPADVPTTAPVAPVVPVAPVKVTLPALTSGSGYALAAAFKADFLETATTVVSNGVTATFNASGQLTAATGTQVFANSYYPLDVPPTATFNVLQSGGSVAEGGNMDGLAWGRWIGSAQLHPNTEYPPPENFGPNNGYHYVVGTPTPVMPTSGSATYTVLGATSPTYLFGSTAPGTFSGTLGVTFGASAQISMNFNVAMPDNRAYQMVGSTSTTSSSFSTTSLTTTSIGTMPACSSGCSTGVTGFFAGTNAERAGIAYRVHDVADSAKTVVGAAAFKKQ